MPRLANARGVKKHWGYNVAEAADVTGVSQNTVYQWIRDGLPTVEGAWPTLIRGADLKAFLGARNGRRKRKLKPGEIFCLPCREAKRPAGDMVEFIPTTGTCGTLSGICPDCDRMIYRHVSRTSLDQVAAGLALTFATAGGTLERPPASPVNRETEDGK